jgi:hypothetical protein
MSSHLTITNINLHHYITFIQVIKEQKYSKEKGKHKYKYQMKQSPKDEVCIISVFPRWLLSWQKTEALLQKNPLS